MASFCTKCGAPLSPDTQFCTACGAPVAATTAPAAYAQPPAPPLPQATPPPYSAPYPPPAAPYPPAPSQGNSALKIVLIIVAVFVGLGILGVAAVGFTAWRIARNVHVDNNGGHVTVNTPGGTFSANSDQSYSAAELGTDLYPGAQSTRGSMKVDTPSGSMVTGVFLTSDSKDQVLAYYKSKLGSDASVYDTPDGAAITLTRGNQESITVSITQKQSEDDGKTKIAIVHTKSNKSS